MTTHAGPKPRLSALGWLAIISGAVLLAILVVNRLEHVGHQPAETQGHAGRGHAPPDAPPWWGLGIAPFVAILGAIAILPLVPATRHWWEHNVNRLGVSAICAGLTVLYSIAAHGVESVASLLDHAIAREYVPFIVLLFGLYVVSGGISLRGDLPAHPITNTAFLAAGALIASFIGTTGASVLLIRPLLQTNAERKHVVHTVVFFIFLVSNVGGCLLPIGDPPLFVGYLRGVSFFWTLGLWKEWAICCALLLAIYFVWETIAYRRETPADIARDETERRPLRLRGSINVLWLAGVVGCVAFVVPGKPFPILGFEVFPFMREVLMLALVAASLVTTPRGVRAESRFNYAAIAEVAALFLGIFVAMQVPVDVLRANGERLAGTINEPWHFFWATGALSSFLDNAPTYAVFFELGKVMPPGADAVALGPDGSLGSISGSILAAVSLGAVFMGAMTYIGNGPNFMVKAIAEQSGVRMPSFLGFMVRYSIPLLVPLFVLMTLLFLRG